MIIKNFWSLTVGESIFQSINSFKKPSILSYDEVIDVTNMNHL